MVEDNYQKNEKYHQNKDKMREIMKNVCIQCQLCKVYRREPARPCVGLPLATHFNQVLTVDIGEVEGDKFLVMVDWNTWFCQAEWIKIKQPKEIINTLLKKWICIFGTPQIFLSDCGREFQNETI